MCGGGCIACCGAGVVAGREQGVVVCAAGLGEGRVKSVVWLELRVFLVLWGGWGRIGDGAMV